eukprot:2337317-Amphidinium_carterae.1
MHGPTYAGHVYGSLQAVSKAVEAVADTDVDDPSAPHLDDRLLEKALASQESHARHPHWSGISRQPFMGLLCHSAMLTTMPDT